MSQDLQALERHLDEACTVIGRLKVENEKLKKAVAQLEKQIREMNVVRLPLSKVVCR